MQNNNKDEINNFCLEIWNQYKPKLEKLCYERLSGNPQDIEDVISDTFKAFYEAVNEGRKIENYQSWLYGTMANLIKMKYSELKKARDNIRSMTGLTTELAYDVDYIDEIMDEDYIDKAREEIYDDLPTKDRELVNLVYENGLKSRQVAELWGCSLAAVKQRRYRAVNKIHNLAKEKTENF